MSSNIFWWFWRLSVQCYQPICDVLLIKRLLWISEIFMKNILWKIFLPRNINNKCSDRKNNKFAFWAEASLWSTLVSCQLCENDLEPEKLSIISQQDSSTCNCSPQKLQYRQHQNVLHQWPVVSYDKGLIRSFPDFRHHSASRTFLLLWKIFLISPEHLYLYWHLALILNTKHRGHFISLLASDTGERSLWL